MRESDDVSIAGARGAVAARARSCEGDAAGAGWLQVSERKSKNDLARDEKKFSPASGITCAANPAATRRSRKSGSAAKRRALLGGDTRGEGVILRINSGWGFRVLEGKAGKSVN